MGVLQRHLRDSDGVRQRDGQRPLRPDERPAFPGVPEGTLGESGGAWPSGRNLGHKRTEAWGAVSTWMAVRGPLVRLKRGIPNTVRRGEAEVYVCEHLLVITLAPSHTHTLIHSKSHSFKRVM